MFNNEDNYGKIMEFLVFLAKTSISLGLIVMLVFFLNIGRIGDLSYIYFGFSIAMLATGVVVYLFLGSLIPPEIKKDIEEQAEKESKKLLDKWFPEEKEEKQEDDKDKRPDNR